MKPYINDGIPPVHRRNAKKQTRLNFTKDTEVGKQEQGTVLNSSASEVTKISRHQAQLAKYKEEAIPGSFKAITRDLGGKLISVTNTCAHDTVLMGLFWLREHEKTLGPIKRAEGEVLNVVPDNIKLKNHVEA